MCQRHGHSSISYLTLSPRLSRYTRKGTEGYIAWRKAGATAVALTDPMTSVDELAELTAAFRQERESKGEKVVFFGVTGRFDREFSSMGYHRYVLGRDSVLDAGRFSLKGNRMENVRRSAAHALRSGLEVLELGGNSDAGLFREMHDLSREWIRLKRTPEIEHLVWKLDEAPNPDIRYFVARSASRIEGFVTYNPIYPTGDWYLDLTRRRQDSVKGMLDCLIVESMKKLRADGMENLYLGMVPDPAIHLQMYRRGLMKWLVGLAAGFSDLLYPVNGEYFFKQKFRPRWNELFIFSAGELSAWRLLDLLEFVQPRGLAGVLGHKLAASFF
jgi:phosphatidylglycerol lysyltransferase